MRDRMTDAGLRTEKPIDEYKLAWPGAAAVMMPMPSEPEDPFACCLPGGGSTHELVFDPNGGTEFWVSGQNYDHIARVTLEGVPTFFAMPPGSLPHGSVFDHQGRLWVTFEGLGQLACIDRDGNIVDTVDVAIKSKMRRERFNTRPHGLTVASDGALWFTGKLTNTVGRVSPDGQVEHFLLPTIGAVPIYVAPDAEGAIWCTELGGSRIARVGADGSVSEHPIPTPNSRPITIKAGPDGNSMWFTQEAGGKLGRIDRAAPHNIIEFPVPLTRRDAILAGHTFDRAGNLWVQQYISPPEFGSTGDDYIIRFDKAINDAAPGDLSGIDISYFRAPSQRTVMHRITLGPDGNIWFSELGLNQIGRITL
ncbi:MAG TPA: hypothetical protein VGC56_07375 [Allosphingosinicella sp.]|jgi:virginiamycin B lyase